MKLVNASKFAAIEAAGAIAVKEFIAFTHVPTSAEVSAGEIVFDLTGTPAVVMTEVRVTATGALKAWDGDVLVTANTVTLNNDGAVDFAATDTVSVILAI